MAGVPSAVHGEFIWALPVQARPFGAGPVAVQENHFFDHRDGALAAARIAVRLRAGGGRALSAQVTLGCQEVGLGIGVGGG